MKQFLGLLLVLFPVLSNVYSSEVTKRYFFVSYSASDGVSNTQGSIWFVKNDGYINRNQTLKLIKEGLFEQNWTVIIRNIIEMNESDFNDFAKEENK